MKHEQNEGRIRHRGERYFQKLREERERCTEGEDGEEEGAIIKDPELFRDIVYSSKTANLISNLSGKPAAHTQPVEGLAPGTPAWWSGRFSPSIWKGGIKSLIQNCLHLFYSLQGGKF